MEILYYLSPPPKRANGDFFAFFQHFRPRKVIRAPEKGKDEIVNVAEFSLKTTSAFHKTGDLLLREVPVGDAPVAVFCFIDSLSDKLLLEQDIVAPVCAHAEELFTLPSEGEDTSPESEAASAMRERLLSSLSFCQDVVVLSLEEGRGKIAEGDVALFAEGYDCLFMFSQRKAEKRAVAEPPTATVLKGPREGFIEEIKTNTALIRRRIRSPDLVFENLSVGRYSVTPVTIAYLHGVADPEVVDRVREKLNAVDIDGVTDGACLAPFLEERKNSFFKQVGNSEKPDVVAAKLLEGRVAVITDGSPIVLTLPFLLLEDMQDGYDYYSGDWRASLARVFRVLGAALTVLLPAGYVALQSYHFHLLPIEFLITLAGATSSIPFPPAAEMLFVLLLFEILNEASMRMPRYLSVSLSIVGAIVLGDTAVKAGLISSPAVLVTALSSIGIFCVPDQVGTLSILRLLFLLASAVLGLFGMIALLAVTTGYLASVQNYGAPYFAPYAPRIRSDLKDGVWKASVTHMDSRPLSFPNQNRTRQKQEDDE